MGDLLRYEPRTQPPLPPRQFAHRLLKHGGYAAVLVAISLAIGTGGYMIFAGDSGVDAFLDASMILGGMGPVVDLTPKSNAAKIFAALYALYAGLLFLVVAGLLIAPVFHRIIHRFHWDETR